MVRAQAALLDHLHLPEIFAVTGGSMGGMQALVWATDYPERVRNCVPIATCTLITPCRSPSMKSGGRQSSPTPTGASAIIYDNPDGARPAHGLAVARMVGHVTYLSNIRCAPSSAAVCSALPSRRTCSRISSPSKVICTIRATALSAGLIPNSYLYLTKAIDRFDFLAGRETRDALDRVRAGFLVISFESDWLYPPSQSRDLVKLLKRHNLAVTYLNCRRLMGTTRS